MALERHVLAKRSVLFLLIGVSIFVCYLYFFVGIPEMVAVIRSVNSFYYSLAVMAFLLDTFFYALTWHYLLLPLSVKTPLRKTFLFVWVGAFVDILVPAESVSGDFSKAYLMSKETNESTGRVAASIISHRILSSVVTLGSLIVGSLSFLVLRHEIPGLILNLILLVSFGTVITLVFLFLLCFKEQMARKITDSLLRLIAFVSRGRWQLTSLKSEARRILKGFHQAIDVLGAHPASLVPPVIFSIMSWLFSLLISLLIFLSLGYPFSFSLIITVVTVYSISCAIQAVPAGIPAEVGIVEPIMITLYALLGVPVDIGGATTILTRILTVWLRLSIGFVATQWVGIKTLAGSSTSVPVEL
ncbi:MAG: flippase-like domain-containing protein [Candidatus Bathyarchaeota archaeon]|nr:MAG: flippase-like domain-containing protein [Candidatus Bathyarchaeota archaeon]